MKSISAAALAVAVATASPAFAQTVGIGTTTGGATAQVSAAISKVVEPNSRIAGLTKPFNALHVDYMLWTYKKQKDEIVYQVAKTMYENEKALRETSPLWRSHSSRTMARKQGTPYRSAAVKFYKEVGIWDE